MKTYMKRFGSGLLALLMVLSLVLVGVPVQTQAATTNKYNTGTRNEICTTLDGTGAIDYYESGYTYDTLSNQSSSQLLQSLRKLMTSTHTYTSSYDDCHYLADHTDCENGDGRVLLLYTSYSATMSSGMAGTVSMSGPNPLAAIVQQVAVRICIISAPRMLVSTVPEATRSTEIPTTERQNTAPIPQPAIWADITAVPILSLWIM